MTLVLLLVLSLQTKAPYGNATLTPPSWWGVMMSVFAFSGVHTDPNTETHPETWFQKSVFFWQRKHQIRVDGQLKRTRLMRFHQNIVS